MPTHDVRLPGSARGPVPWWVSLAVVVLILGGALAAALALEPRGLKTPRPPPRGQVTIFRDVLTGRLLDENGVPLPPEDGPGSSRSHPLRIRFVPSADVAQSAPTVKRLVDFLERRTGRVVEGRTLHDYGLVIQELIQRKCDVAFLTAASYARARYATENNDDPDDDIEAFLQVVRRGQPEYPGSDLAYRAALIVRTDSPIQSVSDIGPDTLVGLGSPTSGASSILPSALFTRLGVRPKIHRIVGYPFIVTAVLQGVVEVGSVWWSAPNEEQPRNDARQLVVESNPDVFEKTRIIGFTAWIPNEPVVCPQALDVEVRHEIARALSLYVAQLTLTEEGRKELVAVGTPVGFIPATNEDFLPLMEVIEQAFADDPEGRRHFMAGSK